MGRYDNYRLPGRKGGRKFATPSWCARSEYSLPSSLKRALQTESFQGSNEGYILPKLFDHRLKKLDELAQRYLELGKKRGLDAQYELLQWDDEIPRSPYAPFYIWASEVWYNWRDDPWQYGFTVPSKRFKLENPNSLRDFAKLITELGEDCTVDLDDIDVVRLYQINGCSHLRGVSSHWPESKKMILV